MFLSSTVGSLIEPLSGRRWDPGTINEETSRRCGLYAGLGVRPGDRVFLHNGNSLEFFADLCAVWLLGACAVPIDARLTPFELEALARTAEPRLSIRNELVDATVSTQRSSPIESALSLDEPALILFTSGTTGNPKGVVHTHRSLRARWTALRPALNLQACRRTLCLLPTHFGHGLICNSLFPWLSGADLFVVPPFRPDIVTDLGRVLDAHEITFMSSVPSLWRLALRTAAPPERGTLERVFCGSAPLSAALWRQIQEWTGTQQVSNVYGITETASWVAGTNVSTISPEDGLIGEPWGAVIKILRSPATEPHPLLHDECATGEAGYVWVRTPALMQGYLHRPDLTGHVVSDGWFVTGDIGVIDERGYLYLRGRERDEINKGGMKVYPADIDAVFDALDGVRDACAFGYDGDPLYGENVGVALVVAEANDEQLRRIYAHVQERLAAHQMPMRWYILDAVPRTARGKTNRRDVADLCTTLAPLDWRTILR
jgi:acyl-CoA synthetase (AMP-forming)/AMP-acid ligase II